MGKISSRHPHLARISKGLAAGAAALFLAAGTASTALASAPPSGAVRLADSASCPFNSLCLYRDYAFEGPGYSIPAGYPTDLHYVPMPGGVGGSSSAANNVSSWINNTGYTVRLIDYEGVDRVLYPGSSLEESPETNDSVDAIDWLA